MFDVNRTVIDVKLNFEQKAVEGKVELDVKIDSIPLNHLEVDATDMDIYNVSVKGIPARFEIYPDSVKIYGEFKPFGHYVITITYRSHPKRGGYFFEEEREIQFWTRGEETDSHAWFPCFDHPDVKSAYEIRITLPPDYNVISYGKLVDRVDGEFSTFIFREDLRSPASLVNVIAGKFKDLDSIKDKVEELSEKMAGL